MARRAKPANGHPQQPKEEASAKPESEAEKQLTFHYIKSNNFRVIHCDGVFGGPCPNGRGLTMGLFSERFPVPLQTTHKLTEASGVGEELARIGRAGIVREVEVEVILAPEEAEALATWIMKHLEQLKTLAAKAKDTK